MPIIHPIPPVFDQNSRVLILGSDDRDAEERAYAFASSAVTELERHGCRAVRLSIGENTTDEEVDYIIRSVTEVVEYLRGFSPIWRDLMAGKKKFIL